MTLRVDRIALHVLAFAPLHATTCGPDAGLARIWSAASMLGLTCAAAGIDHPTELPAEAPQDDVWFRLFAAKADADGRCVAVAFTAHDVAGVIVRLRPATETTDDIALAELSDAWHEALGDAALTGVFGVALVFTGATEVAASSLPADAAETARTLLMRHDENGLESSCLIEPGIAMWDMEMPWGRRTVLFAGDGSASAVGGWCWLTEDRGDVGRMVRYLMHANKLRFEVGVFKNGIAELRELERTLDVGLTQLFSLHQRFEATGAAASEIIDAQSQLGRAQGDATGLLISITHLRDLRQTVSIAAHNLRAYEPAPIGGAPPTMSPFARERTLAEWLDQRVGHEISYLQSCRERVAEAQSLTDLRLKQLAAAHARTANWLTVLQTSVLGALLGAFGVATALGDPFSVPAPVRAAVMTLVATLALALPPLAVRWPNGYGWLELAALGAIGAAAGWLVAVAASAIVESPVPPGIVAAAAALGAALLAVGASLVNGRTTGGRR